MKITKFVQCFSLASRIGLALAAGLYVLAAASRVQAQIVRYTDRDAFVAAAPGLTTFTFDGYTSLTGYTQYPHGLTVQGVKFTTPGDDLFVDDPGDGGGNPFFGHQYMDTAGSPLSITLPEGATAFGAYFSNEGVRNSSTLTVTVNGQPFTFGVPGAIFNGSLFVGFISRTPIISLVISGGTLGPALNYVSFGPLPQPVHEEWNRRWDGPTHQDDAAAKVAVDQDGNLYVAGYSDNASNGTGDDYRLIKYAADGAELWSRRYDGPAHGDDRITGLGLDGAGNVYVAGSSAGIGTQMDYATLKYDKDGSLLWVRRYDTPTHGNDIATALAVDAAGDAFVTGYTQQGSGSTNQSANYLTLKYDPSGRLLWVLGFGSLALGYPKDGAEAIAVDHSGNAYVTGYDQETIHLMTVNVCATLKYSPSGRVLWLSYAATNTITDDKGIALAVDKDDNVYVAGTSAGFFNSSYLTLKYDKNGNEIWRRFHAQSQSDASASAVAVDRSGNILVTGNDGTVKYDPAGNPLWATDNEGGSANALVLDGLGNVYVVGQTRGLNVNFSLIKYGPDGNVYVTGTSNDGSTSYDMRTVKYSQ